MSRNVGKKRGAQPRPSSGGNSGRKSLVAFIGGLLFGLLIAGGIYLADLLPTSLELRERALACDDTRTQDGSTVPPDDSADRKPVTFDFYNMLTKQQTVTPATGRTTTTATPVPTPVPPVVVAPGAPETPAPAPAITDPAPATPAAVAAAPAAANRYALQAGSFATRPEADRRRGELLLSGLDANVQQATTDKGDVRFRVMVGPFADEAGMKKAQQQLAGMKIDTLPVRLK